MNVRELLQFVIEADAKQAIRTFENVEKASTKSLGAAESGWDKFSAGATKAGALALGAAGVASIGLYKLAQNANELDLGMQRIEGQFGDSADAVKEFVTSANEIGLSDRAAARYTASIGELAVGLGIAKDTAAGLSIEAVKVVSQLALLKGIGVEEAIATINAVLIGEFDSMQKLVPEINAAAIQHKALAETGKESAKELTAAEKATAAFHIILESGEGTLNRSGSAMDSLAGKTAVAKANLDDAATSIGAAVLPAVSDAIGIIGDLAAKFNELPVGLQQGIGTVAVWATGLAAAGGVLSLVAGQAQKFVNVMTTVNEATGVRALTGLGKFSAAVAGIGTAIGLAVVAYQMWTKESRETKEAVDDLTEAVKSSGDTLGEVFLRDVADWLADQDDLRKALDKTGESTKSFTTALQGTDEEWKQFVRDFKEGLPDEDIVDQTRIKNLVDAMETQRAAFKGAKEELKDYNEVAPEVADTQGDTTKATRELTGATEQYAGATGKATDEAASFDDALKAGEDALKERNVNLDAAAEGAEKFGDALDDAISRVANASNMGKAFDGLRETVKDLPDSINLIDLALGKYNDEQTKAIDSITGATKANADYLSSLIEQGASTEEVMAAAAGLEAEYRNVLQPALGNNTALTDEYIRMLGLTPEQVVTAIKLSEDEIARQKLEVLQGQLDKLDEGAQAEITAMIAAGDWQGALNLLLTEMAKYSRQNPVEITWKLRPGAGLPPELRGIPTGGATVQGTSGLQRSAASNVQGYGSSLVVVNLPASADGTQVVNSLRRYTRRNGNTVTGGWQPIGET